MQQSIKINFNNLCKILRLKKDLSRFHSASRISIQSQERNERDSRTHLRNNSMIQDSRKLRHRVTRVYVLWCRIEIFCLQKSSLISCECRNSHDEDREEMVEARAQICRARCESCVTGILGLLFLWHKWTNWVLNSRVSWGRQFPDEIDVEILNGPHQMVYGWWGRV